MLHTLIPAKERARFHREYFFRVFIVTAAALAVAVLIGCIGLIPAFASALFQNRSIRAAAAADAHANKVADAALASAKADLQQGGKLLSASPADQSSGSFSAVIKSVVSAASSVSVAGISVSLPSQGSISVSVSGSAPTRDDLISFKSSLEATFPGSKIDIPISTLAKGADIPFDMSFTAKTQ